MGLRGPNAKPVKRRKKPERKKPGPKPKPKEWQSEDKSRAERVIAFLESLPVTSGTLAGTTFQVRPWQRQIIEGIYAVDDYGRRRVREALLTIPRKNGKTALSAGLALCHLVGPEAVPRGELFSAAAKRKQAAKLFEEMKAIIERVPWMRARVAVKNFNKQLEDSETDSIYCALAAEAKTEHGGSSSFWVYDEMAQAPNRELYDVLSTSTGARDEPLGIIISTQSYDPRHIMSELVDYGEQVNSGLVEDPSFFAAIYSAPMDADPWDEATWAACNPALGDFRSLQEMRDSAAKARRMPTREAAFRLLYLNQRVSKEVRFLPKPIWDACGRDETGDLRGRHCIGALDLSGSGKNDLTALALLFDADDGELILQTHFWSAEGGLEEAEARDRVPYRLWAEQGHLLVTPGKILDYGFIANKLAELSGMYDIEAVAVDPWNIDRLVEAVDAIRLDITLEKHGQNIQHMDGAVRALEADCLSGKLVHPKNPILDWCMDNVMVTMDSSGNRKFDKRKATGRIDGAVALAMACNLMSREEVEPSYAVTVIE